MKSKVLFATIVSFLCFSLSTMGIMASVPEDKKEIKDDKVVVKSNVEEMTVEVTEAEPEEETFEEETTKKKKKKKKLKPLNISSDNSSDDDSDYDYPDSDTGSSDDYGYDDSSYDDSSSGGGAVNNYYYGDSSNSSKKKKKKTKTKKYKKTNNSNNSYNNYYKPKKVKKKAIKTQSEKNALSGNKVNLLRSQIKNKVSGSKNGELTNLAKYMAKNGLSNASSAYKKLTNVDGDISCATYKLKVSSGDQLAILEVANKIHELNTSKYGIGISSTQAAVGYKIYVVICYR